MNDFGIRVLEASGKNKGQVIIHHAQDRMTDGFFETEANRLLETFTTTSFLNCLPVNP
ncbi:MAG: hypothetical protein IGS48_05310 [Oscillatoriales cyanobacterium C42_A2020_001]|nr:hypothetical protein [Leptolyngbyaceae cyanobacterium C42_A2020_001]